MANPATRRIAILRLHAEGWNAKAKQALEIYRCCERLAAQGKCALLLVWDNAS